MATPKTPAAAPAAPATPEPRKTVAEEYADFGTAFAEAMEPASAPEPAAAAPSPEGADDAGSAATTGGTSTPSVDEAGTAAPAEPLVAAVEKEPETAEIEAPEAKIARLEAELAAKSVPKEPEKPAEIESKTPEIEQKAPEIEQKTPETGPIEPQWYQPTDEEKALLAAHETNWPDISKAEAVRTKKAVYDAVQYVFAKIAENYNPILKRFDDTANAIAEQLTLGALRSEHQDYDEIYDKVVAWTDTLPTAFRLGAKQVMKEGTPEEVAELISTYKQQAGVQAPAASNTVPTVATRTTELSAPAKKAAQALTVVGSKRTSPIAAADANDFDGAWAEAVNQK